MGKDALYGKDKKGYLSYILGFIIGAAVTAVFIVLFALIMYLSGAAFKYAPVFATLSVALGCFAAAFFTAKRQGSKGLFAGTVVGGIAFMLITLVSLIVNSGGITLNTLFHFIIIMLSSLIGGILGVNKGKSHKYI
ncbi:MAG: TIGR04086 family membrane protein [Acutalibacteraceae bacterium]|nr:TIGR04086 family membrane protein [Acutalibacteraceae bacterium]